MPSTTDYLEKLIAFPTISRDSNLDLIAYLQSRLAALGIASMQVPSEDGRKANLWATIGPEGCPGIALSGHTDVVPVQGQAWTSDPFRLTRRNGNLYGRGSADMKGFIACCLVMAHKAAKAKLESVRDGLKAMTSGGMLFEELGFRYFGPIDGHDLPTLRK